MIKADKKIIYRQKGKDSLFKTWHATDEIIIIFVHSGSGSIVCSEKSYPFKSGTLCLIGPGKYHYTMPENPDIYERSKVFIPWNIFEKVISVSDNDKIKSMKDKSFIYASVDEDFTLLTENIFAEVSTCNGDYEDFIFISAVMRLLVFLHKFSTENIPTPPDLINKSIEYINQNIFREINVDEICSALHISKYYFCRQFKRNTGITVMNYILKTRITLAKNMLLNGAHSVTDVSIKCGFSSVSYFCRVFKEDTGVTPLKFKR